MANKAPKPTKAQLAEAKVRAAASGIAMNQSAKGLRNASKAIVAGASMLPAGRAVKVAATAAKAATKASSAARANARGLKAANKNVGVKYKKGTNESNYSGRNESKPKQVAKSKTRGVGNPNAPMTQPSSYKEAKSAYNAWAKNNPELAKNLKRTKPMENVPKGTSDRFNATLKRLAAEEAKKKK